MPKNPPDISGTRSRTYDTRLPEDKTTLGNKSKSRMGSITAARKKGKLIGMPINGAGISYDKGKWSDNKGRVFGTASVEDGPITLVSQYVKQRKAAGGTGYGGGTGSEGSYTKFKAKRNQTKGALGGLG